MAKPENQDTELTINNNQEAKNTTQVKEAQKNQPSMLYRFFKSIFTPYVAAGNLNHGTSGELHSPQPKK